MVALGANGGAAPTVTAMYMLLFFCLGGAAAIALGLHAVTAAPFDAVLTSLAQVGSGTTEAVLVGFGAGAPLVEVAAPLAGLLVPGLVCVLVAEAVKSGLRLRRMAAVVLLICSLASFAVLGGWYALLLTTLALMAGALLWFATGALLVTPIIWVAGFLAGRLFLAVSREDFPALNDATQALSTYAPMGSALTLALAGVAMLPVGAAAVRLLRR